MSNKIQHDYDSCGDRSVARRQKISVLIQSCIADLEQLNNELDNENPNTELIQNLDRALEHLKSANNCIEY